MAGPPYHGRTHLPGGTDPIGLTEAFNAIYFTATASTSSTQDGDASWSGCDIRTNDGGPQFISPATTFTGSYFTANYGTNAFYVVTVQQTGIYLVEDVYWIANQTGLSAFQMYVEWFAATGAGVVAPSIRSARTVQQSHTGSTLADLAPFTVSSRNVVNVTTAPYSIHVKVSQSAGASITSAHHVDFAITRISD